ncbi:site-specific integrase [Vibrio europaeus]|uniref:site-specific integrase n=1 Tax=Vibrio europaeus TaxID=300876 RepID=UPI00233E9686|nr:site-specific integrase [Vibrio europaeus]MDC5869883.1 site-specific integrase [Vibrio europaeus]
MVMNQKITTKTIKELTPEDKRLNDTVIRGFHARISKSGDVKYYLYYRIQGRQANYFLGPASVLTPTQARDLATAKLAEVVKGVDIQRLKYEEKAIQDQARVLKLGRFLSERYQPYLITRNPKTANKILKDIRSSFRDFLERELTLITAWDIELWRNKKAQQGRAPATINYAVNSLKGALSRAVEWQLIESHDLTKVKSLKFDNTRIRYLSIEEELRLLSAIKLRNAEIVRKRESANLHRSIRRKDLFPSFAAQEFVDYVEPLVITAMNTGLRRGELLQLTWSDINLEQRCLSVSSKNSKSKKTRVVPLNDSVYSTLIKWRSQNLSKIYVFPSQFDTPLSDVKKPWLRLLDKAQISDFRFHDLRHHFASKLVMAGVDLNTVRELLGHSDLKMTLRYAHLAPEHKHAAVNLIG